MKRLHALGAAGAIFLSTLVGCDRKSDGLATMEGLEGRSWKMTHDVYKRLSQEVMGTYGLIPKGAADAVCSAADFRTQLPDGTVIDGRTPDGIVTMEEVDANLAKIYSAFRTYKE